MQGMEADALKKQQIAFAILTLFVLALLLVLHTLFASILGEPSFGVLTTLSFSFLVKFGELVWLQGKPAGLGEQVAKMETFCSISLTFLLSGALAYLTNRDDSPYFVLLAIPILQAAHQLGLLMTLLTVAIADGMMFFWMWHYFLLHPPPDLSEYLEAGMISILYLLMGSLVWILVHQLQIQQAKLFANMKELEVARERLMQEEKLAAIGRLSSGIAHELRNPVAMICSSLATASAPGLSSAEREEMFSIAAHESERLEKLTTEFLSYARPSCPQRSTILVQDLLTFTAESAKACAAQKHIAIEVQTPPNLAIKVDTAQLQGVLLNLLLNAIQATEEFKNIQLGATKEEELLTIEVVNPGPAIPQESVQHIFEPFFTTKARGTGLGLAIARSVLLAHGGNICLKRNDDTAVIFSVTLPNCTTEVSHG
jgi:signal transduction histidine kinase